MAFLLNNATAIVLVVLVLIGCNVVCEAYLPSHRLSNNNNNGRVSSLPQTTRHLPRFFAYTPPNTEDNAPNSSLNKSFHPKIGDFVRYYDIDGGKSDGEVLIGKISFIQKNLGKENSWLVELTEMEDVGDGYYADYPMRKKSSKKATRALEDVSPVFASFVRSENAFKVPKNPKTGEIQVRAPRYDIEDYLGPFSGPNEINLEVIAQDGVTYAALKGTLLKYAAIAGVAGTVIADLLKGTEDAIIYACGALGSIGYLFFLSIKTDSVGSADAKLGSNVSNLRFVMPVLVIVGIALYNQSLGAANPVQNNSNPFATITTEQFASAMLGFLTYRLPLFFSQIQDAFKDEAGNVLLPGSAGVAMQLAKEAEKELAAAGSDGVNDVSNMKPVLVVSGPQATGRPELVKRLIAQGNGRFVEPKRIDGVKDPVKFERLMQRNEIIDLDPTGRYGLTAEGILTATNDDEETESVVVVDADVELVRKLTRVSGTRLIGVWVGLGSVDDFEARLRAQIESGKIQIPEDETKESITRAKIREIVQEIEFGISSGVFEFTIINDNEDDSLRELRNAASYCFK